jgi:voltage-gated potassium channel
VVLFGIFNLLTVLVYTQLENVRWRDALFWITHPSSLDYHEIGDSTKFFAIFVYVAVFLFQVWVAERVLVTIFSRQGTEAWKAMLNDMAIAKVRGHFIVCGYGQVGRTVAEQLKRIDVPFVLVEKDEGLYKELLQEGTLIIQGDAKRRDVLINAGIERARGICVLIDNDADNLYITVTARSLNPSVRVITRAGQKRYAQAMLDSGADEVIIPEYEGGLMVGRIIERYLAIQNRDE